MTDEIREQREEHETKRPSELWCHASKGPPSWSNLFNFWRMKIQEVLILASKIPAGTVTFYYNLLTLSNYIYLKQLGVFTPVCRNVKKLRHGCVITSHINMWVWLLFHALVSIKLCWALGGALGVDIGMLGLQMSWYGRHRFDTQNE